MTVETVSSVAPRVPGRGGSYAPRPSLSAGDNSLAVDLFRRPVDLILPRAETRRHAEQAKHLYLAGANEGRAPRLKACFCTSDPDRTAICGTGGAGNSLDRGFVGLAEATVGIGHHSPDLRWLFIFYYPNL